MNKSNKVTMCSLMALILLTSACMWKSNKKQCCQPQPTVECCDQQAPADAPYQVDAPYQDEYRNAPIVEEPLEVQAQDGAQWVEPVEEVVNVNDEVVGLK